MHLWIPLEQYAVAFFLKFMLNASVFWNVVTEFSCPLGSQFVIECWVHLQQSHFCHHKVFILKKQNHKDHKTQGRHRGGSAETKELFSQMLNQSILPSLWGNSISWLLFTFLQSCPRDKGNRIDKCYHRWYQFHSMHCYFCCKGKRKERNVNNLFQLSWWIRHV